MFKLIFRTIVIIVFLVIVTVALAIWKGGAPFRYVGEKTVTAGKSIAEFGDFLDELIEGGKKIKKNYNKLKDTVRPEDDKEEKRNK